MHIYCSDVRSHSAAPESNKQNPRDRTLDLPIFFRYKHITSLKNLPTPTPNKSLPYWFQGNFAASSVLNFCLREFLLSAFTNRFELRCEPKRLMLLPLFGDASPRQAQRHIGDSCVKWKHFLSDVSDITDQMGTAPGRIERVEMSLKHGCHLMITSDRFHMLPTDRGYVADVSQWSPTVTIIRKPGLTCKHNY